MSENLVTVATFSFPAQAEAARWVLEQEGLQAFVMDANVIAADWFLGNAIGYVKLQVPQDQAAAAVKILEAAPHLQNSPNAKAVDELAAELCLECGAELPPDADACAKCGWTYTEGERVAES